MTAPMRRFPLLLGATLPVLLLVSLNACSDEGTANAPLADRSGPELYKIQNCATCHGNAGAGSATGPALRELAQHWTRESLIEYLHDPVGYRERDERLRGGKQYMLPMPRVLLDEELRGRLADHVLGF
jgi:mono/diheme cytochrome c family protein